MLERVEALEADVPLSESQDVDKPVSFGVYESLLENGYSGPRPTLRETSTRREPQRLQARAERVRRA